MPKLHSKFNPSSLRANAPPVAPGAARVGHPSTRVPALATMVVLVAVFLLSGCGPPRLDTIVIGSKNFTEQLILGELLAQHLEARTSMPVVRRFYLAGTYICHQAVVEGRIDMYVEYTGTALTAVLKEPAAHAEPDAEYDHIKGEYEKRFGLTLAAPLGFDNTFAIEIRGDDARRLHLTTLSQAAQYTPNWRAGFGYEFMERPDGYQGLVRTYGLRFEAAPRIMDLGLLARALKEKQVDLAAGNATDGLIPALDLSVLQDDKHYFPSYEAVPVVRQDLLRRHPEVGRALAELDGKISAEEMRRMNYAVDGQHREAAEVVREFRQKKGL